jgi:hypothetical protein
MKMLMVAVLVAMMMASGCASQQTLTDAVLQAKKTGTEGIFKVYPITSEQAWEIARAVFRWQKVDEVQEHVSERYMIASSGLKMAVFGTVMGVWFEPSTPGFTRITTITKNRGDCCALTNLTPEEFFRLFETGMNIIRKGGTLPAAAP